MNLGRRSSPKKTHPYGWVHVDVALQAANSFTSWLRAHSAQPPRHAGALVRRVLRSVGCIGLWGGGGEVSGSPRGQKEKLPRNTPPNHQEGS